MKVDCQKVRKTSLINRVDKVPSGDVLVVTEIDCGNGLARGYMPAHQHCDVFAPLDGGSAWV